MSSKDAEERLDSASEEVPDPEEDDLDDLDEILDEFSSTKIDAPPPQTAPGLSGPGRPAATSTVESTEGPPAPPPTDEDEFAKQLQAGMADMLRELQSNPEAAKEFEQMMAQLGAPPPGLDFSMPSHTPAASEKAAAAAQSAPTKKAAPPPTTSTSTSGEPPATTSQPTPDDAFQDTIRRTMDRMASSSASVSAATNPSNPASPAEDDVMAQLLQELSKSGSGGAGDDSDDSFSKMLLGMMEQLTNKDILYEPMKELEAKFPKWLEERSAGGAKVGEVPEGDMSRFREQRKLVGEIVARFERKGYSDANTGDREYIVERMQKMQAAGAPPPDLVGDMNAAQEMMGDLDAGCPQQ